MSQRQFVLSVATVVLLMSFMAPEVHAQYAPPPDAYSVTEVNSMFGPAVTMQVYRDGSKVLVDQTRAAQGADQGSHTRTLYDLKAHRNFTWVPGSTSVPCGAGTFSGDWGDPFAEAAQAKSDLAKQSATQVGSATLNGFPTKVMQADIPQGTAKAWVEEKYGLVIRLVLTAKGREPQTLTEIKQLSVSKPAASIFDLPPACAQAAAAPPAPTEADRIAAETGGNAQDYANAIMPPPSKNSCSISFKVVRAGSMEPMTSGFQVAIDTTVDVNHPANYVMGSSNTGRSTFSGGGLHEITGQMRNGVVRIENVPPQFDMELTFGKGGASSALIYRQCFAPQTTLLLVVKNPDRLSDGADWLWSKSGK
jgi:hypothetical protein